MLILCSPEQRADAADDAGNVLIADQEQETLERRFDIDVVHAEDAQRVVQADHAQNGSGFPAGSQGHAERIGVRGAARAAHFDHLDPARLGEVSRVDQVDLARPGSGSGRPSARRSSPGACSDPPGRRRS